MWSCCEPHGSFCMINSKRGKYNPKKNKKIPKHVTTNQVIRSHHLSGESLL